MLLQILYLNVIDNNTKIAENHPWSKLYNFKGYWLLVVTGYCRIFIYKFEWAHMKDLHPYYHRSPSLDYFK